MIAALSKKFNFHATTNKIVYHHWFDLSSGVRNEGIRNNKSCPETNFFGGNKVMDAESNFYPLLIGFINDSEIKLNDNDILKYVMVTSSTLNVREQPNYKSAKVKDRNSIKYGSVLRVYKVENNWLKISNSSEHWESKRYTDKVKKVTVTACTLMLEMGFEQTTLKCEPFYKGEEFLFLK